MIFFTWRSNEIFFSLLRGCIVPICLAWRVLAPNIWSLTAVKANCRAKGKLFMFLISAPPLIFHFSQLPGLFRVQEQFTCLQRLFLTFENSCKEYIISAKTNQVDNSRRLQTWNVCQQNITRLVPPQAHVFSFTPSFAGKFSWRGRPLGTRQSVYTLRCNRR